jgi:hypothetical protein
MKVTSTHKQLGAVSFPEFMGERIYMLPFTKKAGLPAHATRWQRTVDQMLDGIDTDAEIYLMVDETVTLAGTSSRRGGVHVDGYWCPKLYGHRGRGGGHISAYGGSGGYGGSVSDGFTSEAILLASNVSGCAFYEGEYELPEWKMGDCSMVDTTHMVKTIQKPNVVYGGHTLTMLHESLPLQQTAQRTVVRLNVPTVTI